MENTEKKYELTEETVNFHGHKLYRIKALKDFGIVNKGDLGGYIEKEGNLSQENGAWVSGDAYISGNVCIYGNARISGNANVFGNVCIYGNARISGNANVFGNAFISGNARISGNANIFGYACIFDNACISDDAYILGEARISGNANVFGNAYVTKSEDVLNVGPIGSRGDTTTFYKTKVGVNVTCGCFCGTLDEFKQAVHKTHAGNYYNKEYNAAIDLAEIHFKKETTYET